MSDPRLYEQAAACYFQAGLIGDAARCYRLAGAHRRAAGLYLSLGDHREAAVDFARSGMPDLGAWLLVHEVGDQAGARAMLTRPNAEVTWGSGTLDRPRGAARTLRDRLGDPAEAGDAEAEQALFEVDAAGLLRAVVFFGDGRRDRTAAGGDHGERTRSTRPAFRSRRGLVLARCEIADGAAPHAVLPVIDDACAQLADPNSPYDRFVEEWAVALAELVHRYDQVALVFAASVRGRRPGAADRWTRWASRALEVELTVPTPGGG